MSDAIISTVCAIASATISSHFPGDFTIKSLVGQLVSSIIRKIIDLCMKHAVYKSKGKVTPNSINVPYSKSWSSDNTLYEALEKYVMMQAMPPQYSIEQVGNEVKKRICYIEGIHSVMYRGIPLTVSYINPASTNPQDAVSSSKSRSNNSGQEALLARLGFLDDSQCELAFQFLTHLLESRSDNEDVEITHSTYTLKISGDECQWKRNVQYSAKTAASLILNVEAKQSFVDDLNEFVRPETRRWYEEQSIQYTRGYLIHGPPGSGKTSCIKGAARQHGIPLFNIDLSILNNMSKLAAIMTSIATLANTSRMRHHIICFNDVDRYAPFSGPPSAASANRDGGNNVASSGSGSGGGSGGDNANVAALEVANGNHGGYNREQEIACFLAAMDGIMESRGRILIMTCNDLAPLKNTAQNALLRPGRIDSIVEFTLCSTHMIEEIANRFYSPDVPFRFRRGYDDANMQHSPARVVQAILKNPRNVMRAMLDLNIPPLQYECGTPQNTPPKTISESLSSYDTLSSLSLDSLTDMVYDLVPNEGAVHISPRASPTRTTKLSHRTKNTDKSDNTSNSSISSSSNSSGGGNDESRSKKKKNKKNNAEKKGVINSLSLNKKTKKV